MEMKNMQPQVTDGIVDRALGKLLYKGEKHEAHEQKETPRQEAAEHVAYFCPKCKSKIVKDKYCHNCGAKQ
jgi:hypothetical protein